jgi:hypothetical protein
MKRKKSQQERLSWKKMSFDALVTRVEVLAWQRPGSKLAKELEEYLQPELNKRRVLKLINAKE